MESVAAAELPSSSTLVFEEWNGTAATKLTKTATITFSETDKSSSSSPKIQKSSNPFNHITRRVLEALVPEASKSFFLSFHYEFILYLFDVKRFFFLILACLIVYLGVQCGLDDC